MSAVLSRQFQPESLGRTPAKPPRTSSWSIFRQIPTSSIHVPRGLRDHVTDASVSELAANMRSVGMLQPIIVQPLPAERFELVAGERRLRAAHLAEIVAVPAMVVPRETERRDLVSLFENIHREDLSQIEEARVLKRMLQEAGSLERVAKAINKSKAWVSGRLQLLSLGATATSLVTDGVTSDVDVLNAINRASRLNPEAAEQLAHQVRDSEKKREVARQGLEAIRRDLSLASIKSKDDSETRRDVGRLAFEIMRIGSSSDGQATRAREMRQTLSCSNKACCETLKSLLHSAFVLGRKCESSSELNQATDELLILLQGKPRHLQQLLIRAYSMGLRSPLFDFQQVAIA